jgi:hypothetical protein
MVRFKEKLKSRKEGVLWLFYYHKSLGASNLQSFFDVVQAEISETFARIMGCTVCKVIDHDLEEEGYANPDSGYMGMRCKRCGREWGQILY